MSHDIPFVLAFVLSAGLGSSPLGAEPIAPARPAQSETVLAVQEAEHAVDHAWESYHRAALGGTVASPALQAEIEQDLHEARTLLSQAQEAAERGDVHQVERVVRQITLHTSHAIKGSKEQKQ